MSYIPPLTWGQTEEQMKNLLPKAATLFTHDGRITLNGASLMNFPGDCGALILCGANNITKNNIKLLEKIASHSGFSKIFATVVRKYDSNADRDADLRVRWRGWKKVNKGKSNRNQAKDDIVLVRIIKDCVYKGY